jgi:pyruvate,water dikinase
LKTITAARWTNGQVIGIDGQGIYIFRVGAWPETVKSVQGQVLGSSATSSYVGTVRWLKAARLARRLARPGPHRVDIKDMDQVQPGDVLVTDMTDLNWEIR